MKTDNELIEEFIASKSEGAFSKLVQRHVNLVYGSALRQTREPEMARDVTQQVFSTLARKAAGLRQSEKLVAWLHRTTCLASLKAMRSEARRRNREQTAAAMIEINQSPTDPEWENVSPLLDDAVEQLNSRDRTAILLRYFDRKSLGEVGNELGITEEAARKRVSRALDKIRDLLSKQGVKVTAAGLSVMLTSDLSIAAPSGLATIATQQAVANSLGSGTVSLLLNFSLATKAAIGVGTIGTVVTIMSLTGMKPQIEVSEAENSRPVVITQSATYQDGSSEIAIPTSADNNLQILEASGNVSAKPVIQITVMDKETGETIPDAPLELFVRASNVSPSISRSEVYTDENGIYQFFQPNYELSQLRLTTQIEGYADTRLLWEVDQGDVIPESYQLALERAVSIGGWVVNENGQPVSGAEVRFGHRDLPTDSPRPASHEFTSVYARTDLSGRWEINRIAGDMIPLISGSARHAHYVRADYRSNDGDDSSSYEPLLNQEYVFQLFNGITIDGAVADEFGTPIHGARVLAGREGSGDAKEAITDESGRFRLFGCNPEMNDISAQAEGYAPISIQFAVDQPSTRVVFRLSKGRDLKIRVVDQDGLPIEGATVWYDNVNWPLEGAPGTSFKNATDSSGEIVWKNAPKEELLFSISKTGYIRKFGIKVSELKIETIVPLKPALRIQGTVTDAHTREFIPEFEIISGWPNKAIPESDIPETLSWSPLDRNWLVFRNGEYQHTFEDSLIGGRDENPGYVLKFVAKGYESFISRIIDEDERDVTLDIKLRPERVAEIVILDPNGHPVPEAQVVLTELNPRIELKSDATLGKLPDSPMTLRMESDDEGKIKIARDPSHAYMFAVHDKGFVTMSLKDVFETESVTLRNWATLEGVLTFDGEPLAGRKVSFNHNNWPDSPIYITMEIPDFAVETDAHGRFKFPHVPSGSLVMFLLSDTGSESLVKTSLGLIDLDYGTNEFVELELGTALPAESSLSE